MGKDQAHMCMAAQHVSCTKDVQSSERRLRACSLPALAEAQAHRFVQVNTRTHTRECTF